MEFYRVVGGDLLSSLLFITAVNKAVAEPLPELGVPIVRQ